jgi:hypothetical protein
MSRRSVGTCAIVLLAGAIALYWSSQSRALGRRAGLMIAEPISVGDVVFFHTTTWRGRLVRILQQDGDNFTHVGIVVDAGANDVRIAHACPVKPAIVRIERLVNVLARPEITSATVYRPRVRKGEAVRAAAIAEQYASRQTPFDFNFELTDDQAVYCTELVWIAYRQAGLTIKASRNILFPSDLVHAGFFEPLVSLNAE